MTGPSADGLAADYFDGHSGRPRRVRVRIAAGRLEIAGDGIDRRVALADVGWDDPSRRGGRQVALPGGASLQPLDAARWDALRAGAGVGERLAVRASRSWRATLVAVVVVAVAAVAAWMHGVPLAARAAVSLVPESVERRIGDDVLATLVGDLLAPSRLPPPTRERIRGAFAGAVAEAFPAGDAPAWRLEFFRSRIGPNAFALPGGRLVMTDELVRFAETAGPDGEAMLVGVLAHELGHVRFRHGLRGVAQATIASLVAAVVFGDASSLVAAVPVLLLQQGYSRDFEREADRESIRILLAAGLSPAVMAEFFERLPQAAGNRAAGDPAAGEPAAGDPAAGDPAAGDPAAGDPAATPAGSGPPPSGGRPASRLEIALSSHPADAERIRFFRDAAAGR